MSKVMHMALAEMGDEPGMSDHKASILSGMLQDSTLRMNCVLLVQLFPVQPCPLLIIRTSDPSSLGHLALDIL